MRILAFSSKKVEPGFCHKHNLTFRTEEVYCMNCIKFAVRTCDQIDAVHDTIDQILYSVYPFRELKIIECVKIAIINF